MYAEFLGRTAREWEAEGRLVPGELVVVGQHEPAAVAGGVRVGRHDEQGRWLIEEAVDDSGRRWVVRRRYAEDHHALTHAFERTATLVSARHWGEEAWARLERDRRAASVLRLAALMVVPGWERGGDRWDLVETFAELGIEAEGNWWIEGIDDLPPPAELVPQMRREPDGWSVGSAERGIYDPSCTYSDEREACRRLLAEVWAAHTAVSSGWTDVRPSIRAPHRDAVRAALEEALSWVEPEPGAPSP